MDKIILTLNKTDSIHIDRVFQSLNLQPSIQRLDITKKLDKTTIAEQNRLTVSSNAQKLTLQQPVDFVFRGYVNIPLRISNMTDVNLTNVQNRDTIRYDTLTGKWLNIPMGSGTVLEHEETYDHTKLHDAASVTDSPSIDFTLTGQDITASVKESGLSLTNLGEKSYNSLTGKPDLSSLHTATTVADTTTLDLVLTGQLITGNVLESGLHLNDLGEKSYNSLTDKPSLTQLHDAATIADTTTIDMHITGQAISADVKQGGLALNSLGEKSYNSLTDKPTLHDAVTITDTTTIDLGLTGQAITASVKQGGLSLNNLGEKSYNSLTDKPSLSQLHNATTVLDGTTIDFTLTGQQITGEVKENALHLNDLGEKSYNSLTDKPTSLHSAVTVADTTTLDLVLTGQLISGNVLEAGLHLNDLGEKSYNSLTDKPTLHDAVTITDTASIDLSLTEQALSAAVKPAGINLNDLGEKSYNSLTDKPASLHDAVTLATANGLSLTNQVLALGTPSSITASTTNSVTTNTHTHAITGFVTTNTSTTPATKTKISYDAKGLVTGGADATTADIADSSNKRYVTDANLVVIGNTSNTNSGDITLATANGLSLTNQVLALGTPSNITTTSTNLVSTNTHTHAIVGFTPSNTAITGATKTKITYDAKGLVTNGVDATTADIAASTNKNYVTDAGLVVLGNTSNTNSGDETTATIKTKLGITTLSGSNTGDETTATIKTKLGITTLSGSNTGDVSLATNSGLEVSSQVLNMGTPSTITASTTNGVTTNTHTHAITGVLIPNTAIVAATKTKITYDANGLVTAGADATTADIASSTNKRYLTDAQLVVVGNTSNTNSGDETITTIKTKLGITTLSGSNTGDETTSTIKTKLSITTLSGSNTGDVTLGTANGLTLTGQVLSFSGNAATFTVVNEATDTTCFPLFATAATGSLAANTNANLTYNSNTGGLSITAGGNNSALTISSAAATSAVILNIISGDSTDINTGKVFAGSLSTGLAKLMLYTDALAFGPGGAGARDTYLQRTDVSTFEVNSNKAGGAADLIVTGQGAYGSSAIVGALSIHGTQANHDSFFGGAFSNTLNFDSEANADTGAGYVNFYGYQGGQTKFRDFNIADGKGTIITQFDGSAAAMLINHIGELTTSHGIVFSDAVTITSGSITGITDLAVADGGTGSSTGSILGTGAITIQGAANSAGSFRGGNSNAEGTAGGNATLSGGSAIATSTGSNGGAAIIAGANANGDASVARAGGAVTITGGNSKGASAGAAITLTSGQGGDRPETGTNTGLAGGATTILGGVGGSATASEVANTGGAGGVSRNTGGNGGAAITAGTGTNTGGIGGNGGSSSGAGGAASGATSGANLGGNGGTAQLIGGTGGAATNSTLSNTGGDGGEAIIYGGVGGTGATANGNGGDIVFSQSVTNGTRTDRLRSAASGGIGIGLNFTSTRPYGDIGLDIRSATGGFLTLSRFDTSVTANDSLGTIQFWSNDSSTGSTNRIAANIECLAASTITTDINPGILVFRTNTSAVGGSIVENLRLSSNATVPLIGLYGATPVARAAAYTQTYSTASRTVSNATAATLTDSTGGTADTTLAAIEATYTQATIRNNFADLVAMVNKLTADNVVLRQLINSLIDDSQAIGIAQ